MLRWAALVLASVLLHVLVFEWARGGLVFPGQGNAPPETITAVLLPPPAPPAPPPPAPVRQAAPKPAKPAPKKPPAPRVPPADASAPVNAAAPVPSSPAGDGEATASAAPTAPILPEPPPAPAAPAGIPVATAPRYKVSPPPSATLHYDVQALREGREWFGKGVFQWEASGGRYQLTGEASVTLIFRIAVLNFQSQGALNEFGLAPELYTEKPWRKAMTNTHFRHADGRISFSASEASYPYVGGEQDRASVMWQLAGIGRADAAQFAPGTDIDIVVAGARDAETWRIRVVGEEQIDTALGKVSAWHVVRAPKPGSYDQRIDIWLAPQHEWYPMKLRYTYPNGDHLDMSIAELAPVPAPAPR